jgi:hypothetical protein
VFGPQGLLITQFARGCDNAIPPGIAPLFVSKEPLPILNKMERYLNEPGGAKALS